MVGEVSMLAKGRPRSVSTGYTLDKLEEEKKMFLIRDDIIVNRILNFIVIFCIRVWFKLICVMYYNVDLFQKKDQWD